MAKSPKASDIDADAVRKLAELLEETGLTEIEYSHDGWALRVSKGATAVAAQVPAAPLPAAMQLSLHRSLNQAQQYYADVDITKNPATDLLED